jgi:choline dehydrogenase
MSQQRGILLTVTACHGRGRGEVRLRSADALVPPIVRHRMFESDADMLPLIAGCRLVQEAVSAPVFRNHARGWIDPAQSITGDAAWTRFLRETSVLGYHTAGSCRMGRDENAVVDAALRVRGIDGLRIADTSIMPGQVCGNTQAPAYVIGEKAAQLMTGG